MSKGIKDVDPETAYAAVAMAKTTRQPVDIILEEGRSLGQRSNLMRRGNANTVGRHHRTEDMAHYVQPETDTEQPLDHYFR